MKTLIIIFLSSFLFFGCDCTKEEEIMDYKLTMSFVEVADLKKDYPLLFCKVLSGSCGNFAPADVNVQMVGSKNSFSLKPDYPATGDPCNITLRNNFLQKMVEDSFAIKVSSKINNEQVGDKPTKEQFENFCKEISKSLTLIFYSDKISQSKDLMLEGNKYKVYHDSDSLILELSKQLCKNKKEVYIFINPLLTTKTPDSPVIDIGKCDKEEVIRQRDILRDYQSKMSFKASWRNSPEEQQCTQAIQMAEEIIKGNSADCNSFLNIYKKITQKQ